MLRGTFVESGGRPGKGFWVWTCIIILLQILLGYLQPCSLNCLQVTTISLPLPRLDKSTCFTDQPPSIAYCVIFRARHQYKHICSFLPSFFIALSFKSWMLYTLYLVATAFYEPFESFPYHVDSGISLSLTSERG